MSHDVLALPRRRLVSAGGSWQIRSEIAGYVPAAG
jgi:hypothetical protein